MHPMSSPATVPLPPVPTHYRSRQRSGWFHGRLDFLNGNLRFILCWPLAAAAGITLAWSIFYHNLHHEKQQLVSGAMVDVSIIARNHANHAKRTVDSIDQMLLLVKLQWESSSAAMRLETLKEGGLFSRATTIHLAIVDRGGVMRSNTFDNKRSSTFIYVGDRSYFLAHKNATVDFLYIGKPTIGRITGKEIIQYSRRLTDANNQFAGVALLSVGTAYLNDDYDSITLGQNGILGTIGIDGELRSARVGSDMQPAQNSFLTAYLPMPLGEFDELLTSTLIEGKDAFLDGRSRYVSSYPVEGYPLVAFAGMDEQEVMAPYWQRRHAATVNALWMTFAVLLLTLLSTAFSLRLVWRRHQLEIAKASHRMASESGSEGFYLTQALCNTAGMIVDFEVIDCNERGAVFFQRHCNEMIGERVSVLYGPTHFPACRDMLVEAIKTGEHVGELTLSKGHLGRQRFVHVRARARDGRLAVTLRDITHEKEMIRSLERRTLEDGLTGLPNRTWVANFLPEAIGRAKTSQGRLAVLFIDLDGFKAVNDTLGHAAGDEVLRLTARRMVQAAGALTHVVRFGGDEFLIALENIDDAADAAQVAQRVIDAFKETFDIAGLSTLIGTSIGISLYPDHADTAEMLIRHADTAMYAVKTQDKHDYRFFESAVSQDFK